MRGFINQQAAIDFFLLCVITFFGYTTFSQSALLAVILRAHHHPIQDIGLVLGTGGLVTAVFSLVAGPIANRIGNLETVRLGIALLLFAHLSYEFTSSSFFGTECSRIVQGIGYGIFLAPAMAIARSKLAPDRVVYLFGIFSSMISLPNAIGPPLGETYLKLFGTNWFFIFGSIPAAIALFLTIWLGKGEVNRQNLSAQIPLWECVLLPGLRGPLLCIFVVGLFFGLVPSFMAPILIGKHVPLATFFTTFSVTLFGCRFLINAHLERLPRKIMLIWGLNSMMLTLVILALTNSWALVFVSGLSFGFGFSVLYPTLSVWTTDQFRPEQRNNPLAVFTTIFSVGMLLTPLAGAYVIRDFGEQHLLVAMFALGAAPLAYLALLPAHKTLHEATN